MRTYSAINSSASHHRGILAKGGTLALSVLLAGGYCLPAFAQAAESTPPELPSGEQPGGQAPGDSGNAPGGNNSAPGGNAGGGGNSGNTGGSANTQTYDYTGIYSAAIKADGETVSKSDENYSSITSASNVALAQNGGTLTLKGGTLTKSGDDSDGDDCNFYGVNSIALAVGENSKLVLDGTTLTASSEGSNGIFATDNAIAYANGVSINTSLGNSRGLDATYGGTVVANDVAISTKGGHSAAFATDRGGGNISVANSEATTAGSGSPIIYSTGCIEVDGVTGTATDSQIAGMEGLNTIRISNSTLASTNTDKTGSDPIANGVIIYQSTSGDADTSTGSAARFEASDSTLSSAIASGSMFYLTNVTADVVLKNTTLSYDPSKADLVTATGNDSNSWGSAGKNGATANFTGIGQTLEGNAVADTISTLNMYLTSGTTWTGATEIQTNSAGSTSSAPLTVNVDSTSTWVVTGDCTVSALNVASGGKVVDASGKTVSIVAGGTKVVNGESSITVTVTGDYSTTVTTSDAQQISSSTIDRTGFDAQFGTSTSFGTNVGSGSSSDNNNNGASSDNDSTTTAKQTQKISGGTTKKTYKSSNGKLKKARTFKINCKAAYGDATLTYSMSNAYRKSGKKYVCLSGAKAGKVFKVSKSGKVTVKKGTAKGTYKLKVKVKASETSASSAAEKTHSIKVTVK